MLQEEKYARAIKSSHLEVEEAPGDVDQIIAAGMAEPLGVLLIRLRAEWDSAAGELALYKRAQAQWSKHADEEAAKTKSNPDRKCEEAFYRREAIREAVTGRAMAMMTLRSLEPVKRALFGFAWSKARDKARSSDEAAVAALVGRVLDVWLDRLCEKCGGRGFNGGRGSPRIMCVSCGGTGSRRNGRLSKIDADHHFGLWLLNVLDSKCNTSAAQMARKTRQG